MELKKPSSLLDNLWPLILDTNPCYTQIQNSSEYFVPERAFDLIWAHTLLASKNFKNYSKPLEFGCFKSENESLEIADPSQAEETSLSGTHSPRVATLTDKSDQLPQQQVFREKLAYDFINRKFPWYVEPRPITNDGQQFTQPFELEILQNVQVFECKIVVLDVGLRVSLNEIQPWLKFSNYVQMIGVCHDAVMKRKLLLLGDTFLSLQFEENGEHTWHDEVVSSLNVGYCYARQNQLLENGKPFVFVFSSKRDMSKFDTFKVIRKC